MIIQGGNTMENLVRIKQHLFHLLSGCSLKRLLTAVCVVYLVLAAGIHISFTLAAFGENQQAHKVLERQTARVLLQKLTLLESAGEDYKDAEEGSWLPEGYGIVVQAMDNGLLYSGGTMPEGLTLPSPARFSCEFSTQSGTLYFEKNEYSRKYVYLPSRPTALKRARTRSVLLYLLLLSALALLLYRCLIYPLVTIDKILQKAVEGDFDPNYGHLRDSLVMHRIFTNLELLLTDIRQLATKEANAQLMMKQAEINALQSQINPHFLYNTLDTIRGQAFQYGAKDIQIMTLALSKLFRYSISNQKSHVTLEEELNNINNYLMIQQIRFCNKFIIKKQIEPDTLHCKIPKLIVQPIVENAVHHGLEPKMGSGTLTLRSYRTRTRLVIEVKDDGVGIPPDKAEKLNHALACNTAYCEKASGRTSVGLTNTNSRIKLCFGPEYGLSIYSTPSIGSNIIFHLPIQEDTYAP